MAASPIGTWAKKFWYRYYIVIIGVALTLLVTGGLIRYWNRLQDAGAYGYAGCFLISILSGMTIIPVPALPVVFTLGHKLSPLYVGLVAGLGEALGGTTTYMMGSGGGTIWQTIRGKREPAWDAEPAKDENAPTPLMPHRKLEPKERPLYNKIMAPMRRWGGFWLVFGTAALIISPYYIVALGVGALQIGLKKFFLASWAGKTVKGLYVASAGYLGLQWLQNIF